MPVLFSPPGFLFIRVRQDALSRGGEEVAQLVLLQAAHSNQHYRVPDVVIRHVEGCRILGEERCALFEIGTDDKRPRFR
jgi:hypothetical protein